MLKYKCILASIFINVFFLALCLFFGNLRYGALDDFFMAGVLTGIHGDAYNPHLYFVNVLYGYALLPFYHLFPQIGWYYIFEMLGVFISLTGVSYIVVKQVGVAWGSIVTSILLSLVCSDFYLSIQFTQCASLYSAAGMLALLFGLSRNNRKIFVFGILMVLWGSVMRWDAFLMGIPFFCVAILFNKQALLKNWRRMVVIAATLFLLVFSAKIFDESLYNVDVYRSYKEFQGPRAAFGDAHNYNMRAVYEDMEELGKSGADYAMLTDWVFYDTENFRVDSLKKILKYVDLYRDKNTISDISLMLVNTLRDSLDKPVSWIFVFFCLLIFFTNSQKHLYVWISFAIILCEIAYLLSLYRLVYRVELGIWLYAAILAIPIIKEKFQLTRKWTLIIVAIISLVNLVGYYRTGMVVRDATTGRNRASVDEDSTNYAQVFKYIDEHPDKMFLVGMNTYMKFAMHKNPPYLSEPIGSFKRIVSFGYWTPYLPEITESLKEFGITNPIKDVVHDNVISVDVGNLCDYLQRHYYDSVQVQILHKIDDVVFYKYSVVNE